ncbi:hypothetical protein KY341_04175 [Candidatus Woesearchaeota archaeon]|nr:hypothetical protein [Candidatus Woesearchaeota archaeon]
MAVEEFFQTGPKTRAEFIEEKIIAILPEDEREFARPKVIDIINKYVGQDVNALSVLRYAAERGRFDEFMDKLEKHYAESLIYVHPEARRVDGYPGAVRAELFFLECYKEMDIKPQKQTNKQG